MTHDAIRHVLATVAYRTRQVLREIPDGYPEFEPGDGIRPPIEVLGHMSGVLSYAVHCFRPGEFRRLSSLPWEAEKKRFEVALKELDGHLAQGEEPREVSLMAILQGPICDVMTHVGQLATLRRMAGLPVPGENFMKAPIEIGQLEIT